MSTRKLLLIAAGLGLAVRADGRPGAQEQPQHRHPPQAEAAAEPSRQAEASAVESMSSGHHHDGPHMKLTRQRPRTAEDQAKADEVLGKLRPALEKYKDYRVALTDGYQIFLPQLQQPEYHFTNYKNGFLEAFVFDPARPTSLLYRRNGQGYELVGAMYTMPKNATEDQLNARVPLSVARWHLHTNLCMPQKGQMATAEWTRFGLAGSISTQEACAQAGGRFMPTVFGWMVHVYPFRDSEEGIWGH